MMTLLPTILTALSFAFAISIAPGAAFFGIIQTSISKGFKAALHFAMGIALSDIILISLCIWGLANVMQNETTRLLSSFIGGSILIIYGLVTFFNKKSKLQDKRNCDMLQSSGKVTTRATQFAKGFLFNFTNPFVWILWIGVTPYSGTTLTAQVLFFTSIIICVFSFDCLKSFFAWKIKNAITPNIAYLINRVVGVIFCILGCSMIIKMLISIYC